MKAIYAASFDPITFGHLDIIKRAASIFEELVVVIANNSEKKYAFSTEERSSMAREAVSDLSNVSVDICTDRYIAKYAESVEAKVVIRGLRNSNDLQFEQSLAEENHHISPSVETMFLSCRPELMQVSSSLVKGHVGVDPEWELQVSRLVPESVLVNLREGHALKKARRHWSKTMGLLKTQNEGVFNDLVERYSEPHRHYHVLSHIVSMLDELEAVGEYRAPLALAVWFHDAIYDPQASDNEFRSSELALSELLHKLKVSGSLGSIVCNLVLSTNHSMELKKTSDHDALLLHDLDLMILGAPLGTFDDYEEKIRLEYQHITYKKFKRGRCEFLRKLLARKHLFYTKQFRRKFESLAQSNIKRSIKKLCY